jgi:cellulose synthase/poly-beta-1,6-N-acetylglucosamine synthase-like glycosyltransferase
MNISNKTVAPQLNHGLISDLKNNESIKPWLYIFIFTAWFLSILWFHPRLIQLFELANSWVEILALGFFIVFVELAWLYGFYNLGVVLFAIYERNSSRGQRFNEVQITTEQPAVAILYTTYNDFLERSVESCLKQDYKNFKVYILDDSTDSQYKLRVDNFVAKNKNRVQVIRRVDRHGFKAGNLNHALANVALDEPYFAIADADEVLPENFLKKMVAVIHSNPSCAFVQANHVCNPVENSKLAQALGMGIDIHWKWYQPLRNRFGFVMFLGHGAVLRRKCWAEIGGFPEIVSEDLGFAIRAREKGYRGKFVQDVVCYEDFPDNIRAFRVRHMKWTRGTCEFIFKEAGQLLKSRNITWTEKFDILFPTLNLPLTLFYFLFMVDANILLPLFFGQIQPLTMAFGSQEITIPFLALNEKFALIFTPDFFLITLMTFFAPILCFVIELIPRPLQLVKFLSHSTAVYAALSPLSVLGVLSYVITGKATFLVTGDNSQKDEESKSTSDRASRLKHLFKGTLLKSHPDNILVQGFEILVGITFAVFCIFLLQISFFGLCFAFILFPLMHRLSWENPAIQKFVYLPFIIILLGVVVGSLSLFGIQPVFFGYGFHF